MYSNFSHSIVVANQTIFVPQTRDDLSKFVQTNRKKLRAFSAHHAFSSITTNVKDTNTTLIDCRNLNTITLDKSKNIVRVGPAVQFVDLLLMLEKEHLTLRNFTGCFDLSVGGCFNASSHGKGYLPSVGDWVRGVTILRTDTANSEHFDVENDRDTMKLLCGGLGIMGVVVEIELYIVPIEILQAKVIACDVSNGELQNQLRAINLVVPTNYDQMFWIPIVNKVFYIEMRKSPTEEWKQKNNNTETCLGHLSDWTSPLAAKILNGARSNRWLSAHSSFTTLKNLYALALRQAPSQNSHYQLDLPVSNVAARIQSQFEAGEDCELFFPFPRIVEVLNVYNFMHRIVLGDLRPEDIGKNPRDLEQKLILTKNNLWDDLVKCINQRALFTAPLECRFMQATNSAILAPNYRQHVWAISFAWFGKSADLYLYKQTMHVFLKLCLREFQGRFHMGKYHPIGDFDSLYDPFLQELKAPYLDAIQKYQQNALVQAQKNINTNQFVQQFFSL